MVDPIVHPHRRRADAHSVAETLATVPEGSAVQRFTLGGKRESLMYSCGCVAVDPRDAGEHLKLLECPTHAALSGKLRRRQSDRG
jgi:hypothetical protein